MQRGFTILQLLIIVGILVGVTLLPVPYYQKEDSRCFYKPALPNQPFNGTCPKKGWKLGTALWQKMYIKLTSRIYIRPVPKEQICTQEAKICPDGSSVGRTGPNCEFTECPATSSGTLESKEYCHCGLQGCKAGDYHCHPADYPKHYH